MLKEVPSLMALSGLAAVVVGLYALDFKDRKFHNPLTPFRQHRASLYMLGSTALIALTVPIEKISIRSSNPLMYAAASTLGAAVILMLTARINGKRVTGYPKSLLGQMSITAIFQRVSYLTVVYALNIGPVAYNAPAYLRDQIYQHLPKHP